MKKWAWFFSGVLASCFAWPASADYPYRNCQRYIKSASWIERYGEMTLAVIPTDCGRSIYSRETDRAFAELVNKFGKDKYWRNTRGMRDQFACHYSIARKKQVWNLDPYRKDVGYEATEKAGCNPH
ncbi:DUF2599 domain-containing protein [Serratia odorifera]|jgi:hypothetical protein|uniref:DUF2599 domain-containing protein n=2 Tax=Serratia odorifera TaxID=618 RepID=D4DYW2_SEROD|nr:DUF2599 domain-containing protein [Serratia odorifera]EFE97284.1 hypothetical protein HMPREF0758_1112 [Serratia odorifera DSM 4582]VDZ54597.1 Protein of uncharacterised function (DUF2599) [Serratia odorifera]